MLSSEEEGHLWEDEHPLDELGIGITDGLGALLLPGWRAAFPFPIIIIFIGWFDC